MDLPTSIKITIPEDKVKNLKEKLALTGFPDELDGAGWDFGVPLADIKRLITVWKQWDWRQAEKELNEHPHFLTDIAVEGFGALNIHFVHQQSEVSGAIPLLFVHGWPGSFYEVLKLLPLLAHNEGKGPAFHIVAPSLPNFGFSQGVSKRGFALAQYAEICHKLMLKLGYKEYCTQGGDWGFWITRAIGKLYPKACKASHINMIYAKPPSFLISPVLALQHSIYPYDEMDKQGHERTEWFQKESYGYNLLESTKPQTIAYALSDSPVGLLAWIYEKLHDWADDYPWTDDEILTWVSIYWFSRAGPGAPGRIYYEVMNSKTCTYDSLQEYIAGVKLGLTFNPKELYIVPKIWGKTLGDVVYEVENEKGGHFYAFEYPRLLARDMQAMFGKGGGAYGLVTGRDGYATGDG